MESCGRPDISGDDYVKLIITPDTIRNSIIKSGGIPIVLCPTQDIIYYDNRETELTEKDKEILDAQIDLCDGIVMPGGYRIYFYDKYVCQKANEKHIPLFGICMGMQVMCNYNNDNKNIKVEGHRKSNEECMHEVTISKNSKLHNILSKDSIITNSFHSYAVPNSGDYTTVGHVDNVIEAVEKKDDLFNIGIQWHPEVNDDEDSIKLFSAFIEASKKYHEKEHLN